MRLIDRLCDALSLVAAWAYFVVGLMLAYEVAARYFFNSPTIWAEELSRLVFVWATLVASAALIRDDRHIRVTVLTGLMGEAGRRAARALALTVVLAICLLLTVKGAEAPINSFERGRASGTMLNLPAWWAQASVPVAFALASLQAAAELFRTLSGAPLPEDARAHTVE